MSSDQAETGVTLHNQQTPPALPGNSQDLPSSHQSDLSELKNSNPSPDMEPDEEEKGLMPTSPSSQSPQQDCLTYGKNLVLLNSKHLTLFLGPDYICFIATFIIFAGISYLLITYIDGNSQNPWLQAMTKIVCVGHNLSYLMVALSNPGIAKPPSQQNKPRQGKTIFCRKCQFHVPTKAVHCAYCDVCIEGFDHHCPWTSKCIGRNNLVRFYVFLFMTPIYIVYCAFAFGFTLQPDQPSHLNHLTTAGLPNKP